MNSDASSQHAMSPSMQQDLEQRLALIKSGETVRGVLFNCTLQAVKEQSGEEARQRCLATLEEKNFTAFFSYPVKELLKLLYAATAELAGKKEGTEGALRFLGHRTVPSFLDSKVGHLMLELGGKDPRRVMEVLPSGYRLMWTHGVCSMEWTGPRSCTLRLKDCVFPWPFHEGSIREMLEASRVPSVKVNGRSMGLSASAYDITWN